MTGIGTGQNSTEGFRHLPLNLHPAPSMQIVKQITNEANPATRWREALTSVLTR